MNARLAKARPLVHNATDCELMLPARHGRTLMVTEQCLLSPTRNPNLDREGIEHYLKVLHPPPPPPPPPNPEPHNFVPSSVRVISVLLAQALCPHPYPIYCISGERKNFLADV